jgi:LPS-assembly protein
MVSAEIGGVTAHAGMRYAIAQNQLTRLFWRLGYGAGERFGASVTYENLVGEGSVYLRRPLDALFGPEVAAITARAEQLALASRVAFPFGLSVLYEALLQPAASSVLAQQVLAASYGPACDCWRVELQGVHRPLGPDEVRVNLVLGGFGKFGTGG